MARQAARGTQGAPQERMPQADSIATSRAHARPRLPPKRSVPQSIVVGPKLRLWRAGGSSCAPSLRIVAYSLVSAGVVVLLGWGLDIPVLASITPVFPRWPR